LLPASMLARRGDFAATIGRALERKAARWGQRRVAAEVGVARSLRSSTCSATRTSARCTATNTPPTHSAETPRTQSTGASLSSPTVRVKASD